MRTWNLLVHAALGLCFTGVACGASASQALRPDPWSPWQGDWREGAAGGTMPDPVPAQDEHFKWHLQARQSNLGQELVADGAWRVDGDVRLDLQVVASSRDDAPLTLGSQRRRGDWTGRVTRSLLGWKHGAFQLEFGRDWLFREQDRLNELTVGRKMPPVDLLRWSVHTKDQRWDLETLGAKLLSYDRQGDFTRWIARHTITWRPGGVFERVSVGDLLIYTGEHRSLDLATLSPFTPYFLRTFDGSSRSTPTPSQADSSWLADSENNMIWLDWACRLPHMGPWTLRQDGELLVDEFQIDAEDRRRLDDVFGLALGVEAARDMGPAKLSLRLEYLAASRWLYIHPGQETDWVDRGSWIGNEEGGDCREWRMRLRWSSGSRDRAWRPQRVEWSLGLVDKGATEMYQPWDAVNTHGSPVPSGVVERRLESDVQARLADWSPGHGPSLTLDAGVRWQGRDNDGHTQGRHREETRAWLRATLSLGGGKHS
jgi:hypothetical protein